MSRTAPLRTLALAALFVTAVACKDRGAAAGGESAATTTESATLGGAGAEWGTDMTPDAGGQVHVVKMVTDGTGNLFQPAELTVKKGDVIRYTLESGVHNAHFVADSNPNMTGFPTKPSDFLQLPGQTIDLKVNAPAGSYFHQCDPHAALGMVGRVTVQ